MPIPITLAQARGLLDEDEGMGAADGIGLGDGPTEPFGWYELCEAVERQPDVVIGDECRDGEFVADLLTIDGRPATLVTFSWNSGDYDCPALVEGHPTDLSDALEMWLGDLEPEDVAPDHPFHDLAAQAGWKYPLPEREDER